MGASHLSGPLTSTNGFIGPITGSVSATDVTAATVEATTSATIGGGTAITAVLKGTASVTVGTVAAGAESDITVTGTSSVAGDAVIVTPTATAAETGLGIVAAWVPTSGSITIRVTNLNAVAALSGSTQNWTYLLIRS